MPISSTIPWTFCSITVITADATTGVAQQRSIDCLKFARQGVAQSWTSSQVTSLAGHKVYMQAWVQGIVGSRLFKTATATSPTMISE